MSTEGQPLLRILHLVLHLRSTNSQFNEHALPVMHERTISMCTLFPPQIETPAPLRVYPGDGTIRGFLQGLRSALRSEDPHVIHAHSPYTGALFVFAMMLRLGGGALRHRSVYTVHDSFYDFRLRHKLLMLPVFATFSRVVFCSRAARDSCPRVFRLLIGSRERVVANGVDVARVVRAIRPRTAGEERPFTVVSIGRLEPVKDPLTMVESYRQGIGRDGRLVVIGDGALREDLEALVARAGLGDCVTFTGLIDREAVFAHLAGADVFVSTSTGEGLPVAVMEAMASRTPIVLSDIPPHREFGAAPDIIPLVRPGDRDGFAEELRRLRALSAPQRRAIGDALGDLVATRFSLGAMTAGYEVIYRQLAARKQR